MSDEEKVVHKAVLAVFKDRRRPVVFNCGLNMKEEHENLLSAVKACFEEVIVLNEGSSSSGDYYLQKESKEWGGLIDVTGYVQDKEIVHLCCSSLPTFGTTEVGIH